LRASFTANPGVLPEEVHEGKTAAEGQPFATCRALSASGRSSICSNGLTEKVMRADEHFRRYFPDYNELRGERDDLRLNETKL